MTLSKQGQTNMQESIQNMTNVTIGDIFQENRTPNKIMFQHIQKRECKPDLLVFADIKTNKEVVLTESMFYTWYNTTNKLLTA